MSGRTPAADRFAGFALHRIDAFEALETTEEMVARLVPPLRVAHALGTAMLWCLASGAQPGLGASWLVGLGDVDGTTEEAQGLGPLRLPPGAATSRLGAEQAQHLVDGCDEWIALEGMLMPREESNESDELRDALLAQLIQRRFACVVRAVPATPDDIDAELAMLDQVARAGQIQGRSEFASSRSSTELATERYSDIVAAQQLGGWSVEIDVGARPGEALVVAELIAAALDAPGVSFQLEGAQTTARVDGLRRPRRTCLMSSRQVARVVRPPARELPGVALRRRMPFDLNAESDATPDGEERAVDLGVTLDAALLPAGRLRVDTATLNRHALVCGATGSGKSQTVQHMLEELSALGIPWLVIEPAKSEYRAMEARLRARGLDLPVHVIRLGQPDAPPLGLNPLEPAKGFPLQTHLDMVSALFVASFDAAEPFPQILAEALRRCYSDLGWVLATGEYKPSTMGLPASRGQRHPRYPSLADLQRTARDVVHDAGYGHEVRDNVLGFVDVRLGSLRNGTPGRFFEGGHQLDLAALHASNVVIEIEDVGNDLDKAFVIGTVILRLYEHLRVQGPSDGRGLTHVTVVEEAHRLLRRADPGIKPNQAVELFGAMLSEIRAFGEGIVIAEQIPTKILPDVLKNTALQIVHRLPSLEDRRTLAGTTNMDDEMSAFVLSLRPGQAAAFREGMDAPVLLKVDRPDEIPELPQRDINLAGLRQRLRSVGCHDGCRLAPCTGRILAQGPQLAEAVPELPFWLELLFLAHITESPIPRPGRVWRAAVVATLADRAVASCALAGLVEATVEPRWPQVGDFYDPNLLTEALLAASSAILLEGGTPPATDGFAAGRFYLRRVYDHLNASGDATAPHPLTQIWRDELGVDLPDIPAPVQRAWLEQTAHFTYPGHARLVAGTSPSKASAPASRIENLARPLAGGATGHDALVMASHRVTPDHDELVERLATWLAVTR
jgi:hypothetical protein